MGRFDTVDMGVSNGSYRSPTLGCGTTLLLISISCTAYGQVLGSEKACTDFSFRGQTGCLDEQIFRSRAQLDVRYDSMLSELQGKKRAHLMLSQQTWMTYVRAQCDVVGDRMGMSVQWTAIPVQQCMLEMMNDRVRFLTK